MRADDHRAQEGAEAPPSSLVRSRPALFIVGRFAYHVLVWFMAAAVVPLVFGWRATVVTSGSMSPAVDTGDIVVTSPHDGRTLAPGVIAVFSDGVGGQVAHRIVGAVGDGTYVTRGDAAGRVDSTPLTADRITGVARLVIPFAGLPIVWAQQAAWNPFLWMVAVLAAGLLWWHLVSRRPERIEVARW